MIESKEGSHIQHYTQGDDEDEGKNLNAFQQVVAGRNRVKAKRMKCMKDFGVKVSEFVDMTTDSMAKRPLTHFGAYCGVLFTVIMIIVLGGYFELAQLELIDFQISEEIEVQNDFALSDAESLSETANLFPPTPTRVQSLIPFSLFFLYERNGPELFTPNNVQMMCRAEATLVAQNLFPSYCVIDEDVVPNGENTKCSPEGIAAISKFFYPDQDTVIDTDCPILTEDQVNASKTLLLSDPKADSLVDDVTNPRLARSTINLGGPLGEDSPPFVDFEDIDTLFLGDQAEGGYSIVHEEFKDRVLSLMGARDFKDSRFEPSGTTMKVAVHGFYLSFLEFQDVVSTDTLFALGSFIVVTTLVMMYTRSPFFGCCAMLIIVSSIPTGLFVYAVIFQIDYFNSLHILVLFIIMGIGADNIFVLFDAFRQSEIDVMKGIEEDRANGLFNKSKQENMSRVELDQDMKADEHDFEHEIDLEKENAEILRRRLHYTYTRSILSVAHTAITTFLAFIATSVSDLAPIAGFGLFAGFVILMNLFYMTNLLPATLMVYHVYVQPYFSNKDKKLKRPDPNASGEKSRARKALEKYIYLINNTPFPFVALGFTISFGIAMTVFALRLETPTSVESNFRKNHMFTVFQGTFQNSFNVENTDLFAPIQAVFGIKGLDNEGVKKFTTDTFRGNAIFDDEFDFFRRSTQEAIIAFCDTLLDAKCSEPSCFQGYLVLNGTDFCWLEEFANFEDGNETFTDNGRPLEEVSQELDDFLLENPSFIPDVGRIDGEVKFVTLSYQKTIQESQPLQVKAPVIELFRDLTTSFRATAPPGLKSMYQTSFDMVWRHTEEELVSGLYSGMAISLMVSFLVVLTGTRSLIVSSFAITGVATIVMCVLGTIQRMGFELGTAEALAGVMVIGLAVDYTVHLGHMFVHAKHYFLEHDIDDLNHEKEITDFNSRMLVSLASVRSVRLLSDPSKLVEEMKKEKEVYNADLIYFAVDKMGMTVLAGAVTTFLSAMFLLFTTLAFFGKMAVLIALTVLYSCIYAFLFFVPMLRVFGPGKRGYKDHNAGNN